jgi:ribulose-phosphate 3-epimerase
MTTTPIRIAPSLLSADFARLGDEVRNVIEAGADLIHFDVMDNHYVPNLTVGPLVCEAIKPHSTVPIDVHLMVKPVDRIIPDFAKAGASIISFHPEASEHVDRTLGLIREHGCQAGLVFNPATPLSWLDYVLDKVDMSLIMSVNPGFGGQSFIPEALAKLRDAKQRIVASGRDIRLEVDGGVKTDNIGAIAKAGADTFVAGSAIFGSKDYAATIRAMRAEIAKSVTPRTARTPRRPQWRSCRRSAPSLSTWTARCSIPSTRSPARPMRCSSAWAMRKPCRSSTTPRSRR